MPSILMICLAMICLRVSWWGSPPSTSEDVWRYLWDGQRSLLSQPIYTESPQEVAQRRFLKHLSVRGSDASQRQESKQDSYFPQRLLDELTPRVGHPEVPTVYPPGGQLFFALSAHINHMIGGGVLGALLCWRALLLLIELSLLFTWGRITRGDPLKRQALLMYTLCPLGGFESSLGAHLDIIGVTLMIVALVFASAQRWFGSGVALSLGISVKLAPLLITPILIRGALHSPKPRRAFITFVLGGLIALILSSWSMIPELVRLGGVWPGLKTYTVHRSFNGSLYPCIEWITQRALLSLELTKTPEARPIIKIGSALFTLACAWWLSARSRSRAATTYSPLSFTEYVQAAFLTLTIFLSLSPVLYSWYLLWALPLALVVSFDVQLPDRTSALAKTVILCGLLCAWTYIPRLFFLRTNVWDFSDFWVFLEYGTLGLTFVLLTRYNRNPL